MPLQYEIHFSSISRSFGKLCIVPTDLALHVHLPGIVLITDLSTHQEEGREAGGKNRAREAKLITKKGIT